LGGAKSDAKSIVIAVAAVNDAPVLAVPGEQSTAANTPLSISGIAVAGVDAGGCGWLEVSISATYGILSLARTQGLTFKQGDGNLVLVMVFSGTLSDVNAALASLQYLPNTGFMGTDLIQVLVNDLGNTGIGGAKTDSKSIVVKVGSAGTGI